MLFDSIPLFFKLLKSNLLLNTLITTGTISGLDLKEFDYEQHTHNSIVLKNISLGDDEKFYSVVFASYRLPMEPSVEVIDLRLATYNPKFFENTDYFFSEDTSSPENTNPIIAKQRIKKKKIGFRKYSDTPCLSPYVTVMKNPAYGYQIGLTIYSDYEIRRKKIEEIESEMFKVSKK